MDVEGRLQDKATVTSLTRELRQSQRKKRKQLKQRLDNIERAKNRVDRAKEVADNERLIRAGLEAQEATITPSQYKEGAAGEPVG